MPKISVIIPFYNRIEKTVAAINSVLSQAYTDYEVIAINDGSTLDISPITELSGRHTKVRLISHNENKGVSSARNTGIENAEGEYIAFLDSDDVFLPQKLDRQLALMQQHGIDFSHTSYIRKTATESRLVDTSAANGNMVPSIICNCPIATPTVMLKKDILTAYNIRFDAQLKYGEDTVLWLETAKHTKLLGINEPLTVVNVDEQSCINNADRQLEGYKAIVNYVINDKFYKSYDIEIARLFERYIKAVQNTPQYQHYKSTHTKSALELFAKPLSWLETKHGRAYVRIQGVYRRITGKGSSKY